MTKFTTSESPKNENSLLCLLDNLKPKHSMIIFNMVVTKWNNECFEVGTWGKEVIDLDTTIKRILN